MSNTDTANLRARIEAAKAVCDAATPGPWLGDEDSVCMSTGEYLARLFDRYDDPYPDAAQNGAFISLARTLTPALLDVLLTHCAQHEQAEAEYTANLHDTNEMRGPYKPEGLDYMRSLTAALLDVLLAIMRASLEATNEQH